MRRRDGGRFDGFVARYMGDGAMVYFGYPNAHEDNAERAVRAALALSRNVANLQTRGERLARASASQPVSSSSASS